jgi:hypothetical protein
MSAQGDGGAVNAGGADPAPRLGGGDAGASSEPPPGSAPGPAAAAVTAAATTAADGGAGPSGQPARPPPAAAPPAPNSLLGAHKSASPVGWEEPDVAFQLFLAPGPPPPTFPFPAYPFLAAPTLGVYSESYDVSPPIALLSLPPRCALELPEVAPVLAAVVERGLLPGTLDGLDVLVQVHGGLALPAPCAVPGCASGRHVNLVLHPWAFANDGVGADPGVRIEAEVLAGVFHACPGVRTAHVSDFEKAGLPFGRLSRRLVLLHDGRFSPNNCQLSVASDVAGPGRDHPDVATFATLAVDAELRRGVLTMHAVPLGDAPADWARGWLRGRATLADLLAGMQAHAPHLFELVATMLLPVLPPGDADAVAADLTAVTARLDAVHAAAQEAAQAGAAPALTTTAAHGGGH